MGENNFAILDIDADTTKTANDGAGHGEVNLNAERFPEVTKRFESIPHKYFADPNYYKTALSNEGDIAQRVHTLLQKYTSAKDAKDRGVFRTQIVGAFWELIRCVVRGAPGNVPLPKKFLMRFFLLHPNFINAEAKNFFSKLVTENELKQPVYYLDEWFRGVGNGSIRASTSDEVTVVRGNNNVKLQQLLDKAKGKLDGTRSMLASKHSERRDLENSLMDNINVIMAHTPLDGMENVSSNYSDSQKKTFYEIQEALKNLLRNDRELSTLIREYSNAESDARALREKIEDGGEEDVLDLQAINTEFDTIRQAAKMTIGRQGNHFPVLSSEYFRCGPNDVAFRENIVSMLARIESIDCEAFCRVYRNNTNRIAPYVVLMPTYGDRGVCWEPFDKHNRATSRGRIFIPMYPKNLYEALLSAVADLRWQVAKEKASYYWMEEGLTGNYYQWFAAQKLKGNIKEYFIRDYILWMTKEAEGIQKLDKEVRGAFWRHMPFSQEVKEKLRNRSYVYQELYQRDQNRAMSDGY